MSALGRSQRAGQKLTNSRSTHRLSLAHLAEKSIRKNPYLALRNITCESRDGVLFLRGSVPSYYLKQVAQTAVASVVGVGRIVNCIEVSRS
jgi:hypothetical protein